MNFTRVPIFTAIVFIASILGACGANNQADAAQQARIAYAVCVRDHGVPDFPNPDAHGTFAYAGKSATSALPAAVRACTHLLPTSAGGNGGDSQEVAQARQRMYQWARCMRSHGIDQPDPAPVGASIQIPLDNSSAEFRAANKACGNTLNLPQGVQP